ncbi:Uncharacterised protein [Vibrio cholerae]|nr:Uncharacterised protein [Vibrio cholerae]
MSLCALRGFKRDKKKYGDVERRKKDNGGKE